MEIDEIYGISLHQYQNRPCTRDREIKLHPAGIKRIRIFNMVSVHSR